MLNNMIKGSIVFLMMLSLQLSHARERLRLVRADSMVQVELEHKTYIELWGDVQLVQGEAYLNCQYAQWQNRLNKIKMYDQVRIYDGKRTLICDQMIYNGDKKMEHAFGNVSFKNKTQLLTSDHLKYWQEDDVALAAGQVKLSDDSMMVWLTGDSVYYSQTEGYARIPQNPRLFYSDTTAQDTMQIKSLFMEAWEFLGLVSIKNSVEITKSDIRAISQKADYDIENEVLVLTETPEVFHGNQLMIGDTIHVQLVKNKFKGITLLGRSQIIETDSTGKQDKLSGNLIQVFTRNDTINKIWVEGQASSLYHVDDDESDEQGSNLITGDNITILFEDRKLSEIWVRSDPGYSTGEFIPEGYEKRKSGSKGK